MTVEIFRGIMIPFIGTALGAACVFFMKKSMHTLLQKSLAGFAGGVMVAASVWSLLIPAMNYAEHMGKFAFVPAAVGFWLGILFLLLLDHVIPHLHAGSEEAEGPKSSLKKRQCLSWRLHCIMFRKEWRSVLFMRDLRWGKQRSV
jgi:ZIP family zinc transporter